jgi:hypothetical protein
LAEIFIHSIKGSSQAAFQLSLLLAKLIFSFLQFQITFFLFLSASGNMPENYCRRSHFAQNFKNM